MKVFAKRYDELEVYKRAYNLSLVIHRATLMMPVTEQYDIARQIRRASKSICANLAEGFAKQSFSRAEFKRFIAISIGSSDEMQVWIQYSYDLDYIKREEAVLGKNEYQVISKMLQALYKSIS